MRLHSDVVLGAANVGLRMGAAFGRLVLVWALARFMSAADLGLFGLMSTNVFLGTYIVGLELQSTFGREIASASPERAVVLLRDQFLLHGMSYVVLLPLLLLFFPAGFLPWRLIGWFYPLLLAEHLAVELQRVLVYRGRPLTANLLLFLRNSAWALVLLPWLVLQPSARDLTWVWLAWLSGAATAVVCALLALRRLPWRLASTRLDVREMRRLLRIVPIFFATTLLQRAFFAQDRFVLVHNAGEAAVGVYIYLFSIANILVLLVDHGVVQTLGVRLIEVSARGDLGAIKRCETRLLGSGLALTAFALLALVVLSKWVLVLTGKPLYVAALPTLWVLLVATGVYVLANLARTLLFARRTDLKPLFSFALATPVALLAHLILVPRLSHLGTACAVLAGATVLASANWYWVRTTPRPGPTP